MNLDRWKNYAVHRLNRRIAEAINYTGCVVDLGCGTAPYKNLILAKADKYIGVDWYNSLHDQKNVDIFASLIEPLPIENESTDVVVAFQVMEHLPEPLPFLKEAYRILRVDGCMCVTVPLMWHVHEAPHDYYRYTRYGLEYLFRKAGFGKVEVQENTGFWFMMALKFNYHTARWRLGAFKLLLVPIWWLNQELALLLDKWDGHPEETGSYTVCARKLTVAP